MKTFPKTLPEEFHASHLTVFNKVTMFEVQLNLNLVK